MSNKDPEKRKEVYRKWYAEKGLENSRSRKGHKPLAEHLEENARKREISNSPRAKIARTLRYEHNLSIEEYDQMYEEQEGKCAVCGLFFEQYRIGARLSVDHCHKTGVFRGLLCFGCNIVLGHLGDNIDFLKKAVAYLEKPTRPGAGISRKFDETVFVRKRTRD